MRLSINTLLSLLAVGHMCCGYTPGNTQTDQTQITVGLALSDDEDATFAGAVGWTQNPFDDSIDVDQGDLVDVKTIELTSAGVLNIQVQFDSPHVVATVSFHDEYCEQIREQTVESGQQVVVLEQLSVTPGRYFIRVAATAGASDYTVERQWAFNTVIGPIPAELRELMMGTSYPDDCPITLDDLSLLRVSYWGEDGEVHLGELVVADHYAEDLAIVFETLFDARFVIAQMRPISEYSGSDDASTEDNNTSAFNCRAVTGGSRWSEHSYGHAIDINPLWNPYVRGELVLPIGAEAFVDRERRHPGLIVADDVVVRAFADIGWEWGGDWSRTKDYQHFSATGR